MKTIVLLSMLTTITSTLFAFEYRDGFESETCGGAPSHWVVKYPPDPGGWKVACEAENRYYQQPRLLPEVQYSYLHVFERNPVFEGKFRVDSTLGGRLAFLIRYNAEGSYVKLQYDFTKSCYEILEQEESNQPMYLRARYCESLDQQWHRFRIVVRDRSAQLFVDGNLKIATDQLLHRTFGRVGFETQHLAASFDDISYTGSSGRVNDGIVEYELDVFDKDSNNIAQHLTIETLEDGSVLGMGATADHRVVKHNLRFPMFLLRSNDRGLTWEGTATGNLQFPTAEGDTIKHCCPQLLRLHSGELLSVRMTDQKEAEFVLSSDGGKTWRKGGKIPNINRHGMMPDKLMQTEGGAIYGALQRNLYVSRDAGRHWELVIPYPLYEAESRFKSVQEMQSVELPNGHLKTYARDGRLPANTLVAGLSIPGVRWNDLNEELNNTPFVAPKCAFSVERDRYQPNHYYMFWTYNDRNDEPSVNNLPRTRLALAVSYDGTKTWKYVMDLDEWGYPSTGFGDKDNRYANHAMHVGKDFIYLTVKRRNPIGKTKHEDGHVWFTRVEKSKIQVYEAFPGTQY